MAEGWRGAVNGLTHIWFRQQAMSAPGGWVANFSSAAAAGARKRARAAAGAAAPATAPAAAARRPAKAAAKAPERPPITEAAAATHSAGLSESQLVAFQAVVRERNVFITGPAGTGKSRLVLQLLEALRESDTPFNVTAFTGIAAAPLGGTTLNAFLCMRPGEPVDMVVARLKDKWHAEQRARVRACRVLFVDEVSMLPSDMLGDVVEVLRRVRGSLRLPQFVLSGDFCQLGPVEASECKLFETDAWTALDPQLCELVGSFRQAGASPAFRRALDEIRYGEPSPATLAFLQGKTGPAAAAAAAAAFPRDMLPTVLHPRRHGVEEVNLANMAALPGPPPHRFPAEMWFMAPAPGGRGRWDTPLMEVVSRDAVVDALFPPALAGVVVSWPCKGVAGQSKGNLRGFLMEAARMLEASRLPGVALLKPGAQVMFTVNNASLGVVNGTRGIVVGVDPEKPPSVQVRLENGAEVTVAQVTRTQEWAEGGGLVALKQFPLQLAWAVTLHKAQGMSLSYVKLNLTDSFAAGMAYVGLSRLTSEVGLVIEGLHPRKLAHVDAKAVAWHRKVASAAAAAPAPPSKDDESESE